MLRVKAFILGLLVAIVLWNGRPAGLVQAHANLVHSVPAPGDALKTFPASVQMEFSEAIVPQSISVRLLDANKKVVDAGTLVLSPSDPKGFAVAFPSQPDGLYAIRWQVQSAVDGHITSGTIPFAVGQVGPKASLLPPPGVPDPAADLPSPLDVILRGLAYISLLLAAGPLVFGVVLWRPVVCRVGAAAAGWDEMLARWTRRLVRWGAVAGIAGLVGLAAWQQWQLNSFSGTTNGEPAALTRSDWIMLARLAALIVLLILPGFLPPAGQGRVGRWWLGIGAAAALLATFALSGHNAALGSGAALPVIADGLHIAAMSAWIGGLLPLAVLLLRSKGAQGAAQGAAQDPARGAGQAALSEGGVSSALVARASARFSNLALAAVGVLGITGLYSALLQVQTLDALLETRYGQALLVKTGLFAVLVGLGAINQRILLPAMARADNRAFRRLGRSVRVEYGLGLLLLLVVGALMSLSPAHEALLAEHALGFHERYREGAVQLDLRVAPARVGENEIGVDIDDRRPGAGSVPPTVLLRFHMLMDNMDMGTVQVNTAPGAKNRYTARGTYLTMNGTWQVEVIMRKPGFDDVVHDFIIDLTKYVGE